MYLDNAATTELDPQVKEYIISILDLYGNPSSTYSKGVESRSLIEHARESVGNFLNVPSKQIHDSIIFTSSGSSANTLAIKGIKNAMLYYSPIAHKSMVLACESNPYNCRLKVNQVGTIDLEDLCMKLESCIYGKQPVVCVDAANSEIGTVQPLNEIIDVVHKHNGIVILDVTGYIPCFKVNINQIDADIITFSAHKLHSLKGCGVLYKKPHIQLTPLVYGSQEQGLFGGTENVLGIASLGKAIELYDYSLTNSALDNSNYILNHLENNIPDFLLVGSKTNRLKNNLYLCFPGIEGDALVSLLDLEDIQVSTGSACNNGSINPSPTLTAIGMEPQYLHSCIRITFNGKESKNELNRLCESIIGCVRILKMMNE